MLASIATASSAFGQSSNILGGAKERQPGYGEMENFTILSYSDLDGWDQAAEFRVSKDGKHAYISNYQGFSIVDVSDPSKPRVISQVKNDPSVQSQYIDVLGNLLVVNQDGVRDEKIKTWDGGHSTFRYHRSGKAARSRVFSKPTWRPPRRPWLLAPRRSEARQIRIHRDHHRRLLRRHSDDRRHQRSGESERGFALVVSGAAHRRRRKAGRKLGRADGGLRDGLPKIWVSLHDITTYKDRAYLAYRDQGVIILDISDIRKPTKISQIKWSPPEEGNTHSIGIVIPPHGGRPDVILATDEITSAKQCPFGYLHVIDVRIEPNPVQIGTFRLPLNRFCPPDRPGRRFGIHDIERMVKGNIVFSAWENSGFWAIDISDPYQPKAVGHFVPPVFRTREF